MEQERKDILDRNETEKMCSLVGNEAGEMCSPADTDTCGSYMLPCQKMICRHLTSAHAVAG